MSSTPSQSAPDANKGNELWLDRTLRPSAWDDYVGQTGVKENLRILLAAARERSHAPEHLLFYGPPGLGKTTLAHLISRELESNMKTTSGPAIERVGDLAAILTNLSHGDVLFIDEIHRLNKSIEEVLYPALEAGVLDIIIGKGPSARTIQLELPSFTLVAATTRVALLSSPLRSRFSGGTFRLEFYTVDELARILIRSASLLGIDIDHEAAIAIAERSRATPRTANYLLKRVRDYAQVHHRPIDMDVVHATFTLLEIDALGLSRSDRRLLSILIETFGGGPVGLTTIAAATSEEDATIEEVYEPYLMQLGLLERTPRGRVATRRAYEHLGRTPPSSPETPPQQSLL